MGQELNLKKHYAVQHEPPRANVDHVKRKFLDIRYASLSEAQKLDVYLPAEGEGPFPVIISIHGGAFMAGDKTSIQLMSSLAGLKRGYAVVAINYRLSGEARFPAMVHDAKAAVRWVRANAQLYHFDPRRIAAWGGSAGGYLALMLGMSAGVDTLEDLSLGHPEQSCAVQAVVDWFGPSDFLEMDEQLVENGLSPVPGQEHSGANSPESLFMGQRITEIPDQVRAANPLTYIQSKAPPFLIQHGTKDDTVPVQQSINLAASLKTVLGSQMVTLELLEGAGHGDPRFRTPENIAKVLDFLDNHLLSKPSNTSMETAT
jgi:acetyl esterase/lipase